MSSHHLSTRESSRIYTLGKAFNSLNITRSLYLIVFFFMNIGALLKTLFFGPTANLLFTSSEYSGMTVGFFIFGFIFLSIPRFIGNIIYIYQLKQTSQEIEDKYLKKAYRFQKIRIALYLMMVILLISITVTIFSLLDDYFRRMEMYADFGDIMEALRIFSTIVDLTPSFISKVVLFALIALGEKISNIVTWSQINQWLQIQSTLTERDSKFSQYTSKGSMYIKIGLFVIFLDNFIGNVLFNIGLHYLSKAIRWNFPDEIIFTSDKYRYTHQYQRNDTNQNRPIPESSALRPTPEYFNINRPTQTNYQINFCGYCGSKITNVNAKFCGNCGTELN